MAKRLYNEFDFTGEIHIPEKIYFKSYDNGRGYLSHKLTFGMKESKTNSVLLELFGGKREDGQGVVYTFSKNLHGKSGSKLEIPFSERLSPATLDMVADFAKIVVDLETDFEKKDEYMQLKYKINSLERKEDFADADREKLQEYKEKFKSLATNRHEFISEYDAVLFLKENLDEYKDKKFHMSGNMEWQEYKGKFYKKYIPNIIELAPSDNKNKLRAKVNIFFDKNALDESDFKEEKKIYIDGYVQSYVRDVKGDKYFPQQFIINGAKIDFDNEKLKKRFEFIRDTFKVTGRNFYNIQSNISIYSGAETVEFTYDELTQKQKEAVDLGLNELDDFKPKGGMLGQNIEEFRIVSPILKGDFTEGAIDTDLTQSEFEEEIVKSTADIDYKDVEKKAETKKEDKKETQQEPEIDIDDYFS